MSTRRNHAARTHTLGGMRLQALRKQAAKTQLVVEVDAELGSGYMQRIESGKVRQPERATLERILAALEAGYSERHDILALFGYLVATPLPTEDEIAWARRVSAHELHELPFPAYVLDCGQRLLTWNRHVPHLFPIVADQAERISREHWSMLHLWFEPRYGITKLIRNPQTFFPQMVHAFRHQMQQFGNEAWCQKVYEDLMRLPLFNTSWERASTQAPLASAARRGAGAACAPAWWHASVSHWSRTVYARRALPHCVLAASRPDHDAAMRRVGRIVNRVQAKIEDRR